MEDEDKKRVECRRYLKGALKDDFCLSHTTSWMTASSAEELKLSSWYRAEIKSSNLIHKQIQSLSIVAVFCVVVP
jgi:hypothetical protein